MRPLRRDPAPSRLAYRLQRLRLSPGLMRFLRTGLPLLVVAAAAAGWLSDEDRRLALADGAAEIRRDLETRPEFMVALMAVEGASAPVAEAVRARAGVELPVSSFDLDLDAIRVAAEEVMAVAAATVRVRSGGVLEIAVTERVPAVVWRGGDGLWLLDAEGHPVARLAARADRPDLPLLAGEGAAGRIAEALTLLAAAEPLAARLRGVLRVGERRWDVVLDPDQRIMLPEVAPVAALERVIAMDQVQTLLARDVAVVDLRNPARPTLRLGPDAARALSRTSQEARIP